MKCPERELRGQMSNAEFWEHVESGRHEVLEYLKEDDEPSVDEQLEDLLRCPVCGEFNHCAVDSEGRPLIHSEGLQSSG